MTTLQPLETVRVLCKVNINPYNSFLVLRSILPALLRLSVAVWPQLDHIFLKVLISHLTR